MTQAHSHAFIASPADQTVLYKEDRPRRIDLTISFFGENEDTCGDQLLEALSAERIEP